MLEVVSIFCGEGARICVRGRWSGGSNLCAGKVDRRRADGHVRSWASLCEVARLSAAWHTFRQSISARPYSQPKGPIPWTLSGTFALMYGGIRSKGPRNRPYPRTLYIYPLPSDLLGFESAFLHRHTPNPKDLKTGRKPRTVAIF